MGRRGNRRNEGRRREERGGRRGEGGEGREERGRRREGEIGLLIVSLQE